MCASASRSAVALSVQGLVAGRVIEIWGVLAPSRISIFYCAPEPPAKVRSFERLWRRQPPERDPRGSCRRAPHDGLTPRGRLRSSYRTEVLLSGAPYHLDDLGQDLQGGRKSAHQSWRPPWRAMGPWRPIATCPDPLFCLWARAAGAASVRREAWVFPRTFHATLWTSLGTSCPDVNQFWPRLRPADLLCRRLWSHIGHILVKDCPHLARSVSARGQQHQCCHHGCNTAVNISPELVMFWFSSGRCRTRGSGASSAAPSVWSRSGSTVARSWPGWAQHWALCGQK